MLVEGKLLEGKTALITGAARGIGRAIALQFAAQGCNIAFTDLEFKEQTAKTLHDIEQLGVHARAFASDAADFEAAHKLAMDVLQEFGQIDILVNNAGITRDTLMMRMTEQ